MTDPEADADNRNVKIEKGLNLPIMFRVLAGIAVLVVLIAAAAFYFDNDSIVRNLPWGAGAAVMAGDFYAAGGQVRAGISSKIQSSVGISSRVQTLEDKVAALEEEKLIMNAKIHEIQSFVLSTMVRTSSRVQTLEDKVAALEEEKSKMNTEIHELDSKFATMKSAMIISIERIHGAAESQAHEHSTLKDQVDRAEASVDGIKARVDEVQAQLEAIMNAWEV